MANGFGFMPRIPSWIPPQLAQEVAFQAVTNPQRVALPALALAAAPVGAAVGGVSGAVTSSRPGTIAPNALRGAARGAGAVAGVPFGALAGWELGKAVGPAKSLTLPLLGGATGAVLGGMGGYKGMRWLTGEKEEEKKSRKEANMTPTEFGVRLAKEAFANFGQTMMARPSAPIPGLGTTMMSAAPGGPPAAGAAPAPATLNPAGAPPISATRNPWGLPATRNPAGPIHPAPAPAPAPATLNPAGAPPISAPKGGPAPAAPSPGAAKAAHILWAESLVTKSAAIGHPAAHASAAFDRMAKAAGSKTTAKKRVSSSAKPRGS